MGERFSLEEDQLSAEQLFEKTETTITKGLKGAYRLFLTRMVREIVRVGAESVCSWTDDSQGLRTIFDFFKTPLSQKSDNIKVGVFSHLEECSKEAPTSLDAGRCGTRILIHLSDTAFMLETLRYYLKQSGLTCFAQVHTTFTVIRSSRTGGLKNISSGSEKAGLLKQDSSGKQIVGDSEQSLPSGQEMSREMLLVIQTEPVSSDKQISTLRRDLKAVLTAVKRSVNDYLEFRAQIESIGRRLKGLEKGEDAHFLHWTADFNFVFMGMRTVIADESGLVDAPDERSLGVFSGTRYKSLLDRVMPGMRQEVDAILAETIKMHPDEMLSIEFCQHGHSIIYAAEGVDFFSIKIPIDSEGKISETATGRWRITVILGRFSRTALASRSSSIPILSAKLKKTLALAGHPRGSYLFHEFRSLFDRLPPRELFYSSPETIAAQIREILTMQGDTDVRAMERIGHHDNYVAVLVAVSRNRYRFKLQDTIRRFLSKHLPYPVTTIDTADAGTLSLIVCYANHDPGTELVFDREAVEKGLRELVLLWSDKLREALDALYRPDNASYLYNAYTNAFDTVYKESTPPHEAAEDIGILNGFGKKKRFAARVITHDDGASFIKIYTRDTIELTRIVQTFDRFGITCLHELSCRVTLPDDSLFRIQRFEITGGKSKLKKLKKRSDLFCDALSEIHNERLHDDTLNRLVLSEGFSPMDVFLIRGLRQYLLQINPKLALETINRVLISHHALAALILEAFRIRFDPEVKDRKRAAVSIRERFDSELANVTKLQDDQILRRLFNIVESCLRTNAYQTRENRALSFKIESSHIDEMPIPRPWREIFVLGIHMEGIHLRGDRVSRGGLRFSDRLDDYRTEILGLMKTQMVKNAIIVPMGAKGGFIVPSYGTGPGKSSKEWVTAQYQTFIRALLDITDNMDETTVVHPESVVIHDEEDPYLVVAADKGTATFSDIANKIAEDEYGFWLKDAFASGGSNGYDHKKVGITANGAWECVRLHFLEKGQDIVEDSFTVVGIGDMSGDVFGNGLLASNRIRLLGAFNHLHIFLDPYPDPDSSFRERQRLFILPRSSWTDYDASLISEGGGVFNRSAKSIPLNPVLQTLLQTKEAALSGEEVIRALLKAEVDLLYSGGIGTYIRASGESDLEVSDKANDSVRVNARDLRASILAEGGNLGITQKGRMEYAATRPGLPPGRVNTDAVDNSGGVDLSDHEVNLKILFDHLIRIGELDGVAERNELMAKLTDEVANNVLQDNRDQHMSISRDELFSQQNPEVYPEALSLLRAEANLDVEAEQIPDPETLRNLLESGKTSAMSRPLLAVMLGYTKILTYRALLDSEVVNLFFFERYLTDYFPVSLSRDFGTHLSDHVLKKEIIATTLSNRVLNQTGVGPFLAAYSKLRRLRRQKPILPSLIKAYVIAEHLVDAATFREEVMDLGSDVSSDLKYRALLEMEQVLLHLASWMLNHLGDERITVDVINLYGKVILSFRSTLWDVMPTLTTPRRMAELTAQRKQLQAQGFTEKLATETVLIPYMRDIMTILHIKEILHTRFDPVGHLYIQVDDFFGLSWIEERLQQVRHRDAWGRMNLENIRRELWEVRTKLVKRIITFRRHYESVAEAFDNYLEEVALENETYHGLLNELRKSDQVDLLPLSVLVRKLRDLLLFDTGDDL
ncbi:MAG: NAD-glutamate dehydrogenase [Magnetococcales bacterium]|nr:NAD-glutamate dehydrogenase [Magnetococcales bacterium]